MNKKISDNINIKVTKEQEKQILMFEKLTGKPFPFHTIMAQMGIAQIDLTVLSNWFPKESPMAGIENKFGKECMLLVEKILEW